MLQQDFLKQMAIMPEVEQRKRERKEKLLEIPYFHNEELQRASQARTSGCDGADLPLATGRTLLHVSASGTTLDSREEMYPRLNI